MTLVQMPVDLRKSHSCLSYRKPAQEMWQT